jgi:site-specific DNA recombinase
VLRLYQAELSRVRHLRRKQMRIAVYARVSTQNQSQAQTIEQQLERLQTHSQAQGWEWQEASIFRDDGYSGASLKRPGLDCLRDQVA